MLESNVFEDSHFLLDEGPYRYRALRYRKANPQVGWDVFALQGGLRALGIPIVVDGVFGPKTKKATIAFQESAGLVVDGIAGIATQREVGKQICFKQSEAYGLQEGVPFGHFEYESSCQLGNHTPPYPDGERDIGPVQCNTNYFSHSFGFMPPKAIEECARRVSSKLELYKQNQLARPTADRLSARRCLELACGSWNAPSWTDFLARGGVLGPVSSAKIESYIDEVTVYLLP